MKTQNPEKNFYANPYVSVDCAIFGYEDEQLKVLLIERAQSPDEVKGKKINNLALPGDLILADEDLDTAARRVLKELTSLENIYLEQFAAFSDPDRVRNPNDIEWLKSVRKDPDARAITVAYYSLVDIKKYSQPKAHSFAKRVQWYALTEVPILAFDHSEILQKAHLSLKRKLRLEPVGLNLLPEKFTLSELQKLYEAILERELDKRNFRRKFLKDGILEQLNEKQKGVRHKPACFYAFNKKKYDHLQSNDFNY